MNQKWTVDIDNMKFIFVSILLLGASLSSRASTFEWQTATPESQGMSSQKLDALKDNLVARDTKAFLVIRNDRIVYEWYASGHGPAKRHYTASMAKAIVGGVSLGVAMTDGRITLDDPAAKFVPQWKSDPWKSKITVRQLGSHTSGIEDAEAGNLPHTQLTGWKGDFWKRSVPGRDPFTVSRDAAPALFEPGEKIQYSNPGIAMLTYCVTAALRNAPHKDIRSLLRDRVMLPIGVPDEEWSAGYEHTYTVDGLLLVGSWGGGGYTARAVARVGRLMLREGNWEGKQLLSKEAVRQITRDVGTPGNCAIGWWNNNDAQYATIPKDAFWGSGAGHQIALVIPSLNLVAVRNGANLDVAPSEPNQWHNPVRQFLFEPLVDAITDPQTKPAEHAAHYPPSPVVKNVVWAPESEIIRRAKGGDNWPATWADDNALYTAYGDGWGFEPFVPKKLSMGIVKVLGTPPEFQGVNINAPSAEFSGDGQRGRKASGMLMVDGVLYLLARNLDNAQLAWSRDHGATWTWADWKFATSFGHPTFLNFGKNYAGARDEFVYVYSNDHDSAYEAADQMVMARVPKDRITDGNAFEFFRGLDASGEPRWTRDINQRGAVFKHPGKCYRGGITYNAGLKRYLWCQVLPASTHAQGPRFQGGFGIYDAPEPWGPWTTVFYTEEWDVGPGETSSFPAKWMSEDGRSAWLLFSGDDHFSVRQATFELADTSKTKQTVSSEAHGLLKVKSESGTVVVTSSGTPGWKAVIDGKRGGVITELRIPADGENIASNDGSRFEGLCNLVYVDFKETGKDHLGYVAKGSLYYFGTTQTLSVVEERTDCVIVEVTGVAGNQVAPKADVLRYRQRYTFGVDRIVCDGDVEWLFDAVAPGSRPELIQLNHMFAPGAVSGEMSVRDANTGPVPLAQTNSKGRNYPEGIDYPLTVEVPVRGGHALRFRSVEMPDDLVQARFYWNEYPRQIEGKRGFAFKAWEGWPGNGQVHFPNDQPISYRYELEIAAANSGD